ncbi:probable cytochrome P450 6a14 [Anopheles aquasalis]|uniref:probable cytochrome P450 6a14 n=1 Tax=Anopheles aquasalis TaxID=42839 RepID=UPI00215B6C94|nr:probable cytochrome P450 6a14 [Anopheles aquasalis]
MGVFSSVLLAFVALLSLVYFYLRQKHAFWRNRGFPCKPNPKLLTGHLDPSVHGSYVNQELYHYAKARGDRYIGISFFFMPLVVIYDLELIKTILVKDFNVFHDRGMYSNPKADPLSGTLFAIEGQEWRTLRQKLTPTFTSGRMKQMFGTMLLVAERLREVLGAADQQTSFSAGREMKDVLARFTTDVIGTCAFGIECNSLADPDSEFLRYGNKVFQFKLSSLLKFIFIMMYMETAKRLGIKGTDGDVEAFFMNLVRETVEHREKHNIQRNDFLNLLIEIKNKGSLPEHGHDGATEGDASVAGTEHGMTMNELSAQVFIFFLAGFETSSTTMNFCLYELAKNQDIQERLREEINGAIEANGGQLTYDVVMNIQYLDQVINETLRKYPPLESVNRCPVRDYTIPGTNHVIPRGVLVSVPIYAIHHDPEYYPDPERFDPDRFTEEAVKNRVPYTYLPFGEGPRICIGLRFGMMQVKVGLITMLRDFRFHPSSQTPDRITFDKNILILSPSKGNYLHIEKL